MDSNDFILICAIILIIASCAGLIYGVYAMYDVKKRNEKFRKKFSKILK